MAVYFDYAATQPLRQVAIDAWLAAAGALNPGAAYSSGRQARSLLDDARETIAQLMGCEPIEVIFTASGTEADNIAIQGLYQARVAAGKPRRVLSTAIEHPAVRETVASLASRAGAEVEFLKVRASGHLDLSACAVTTGSAAGAAGAAGDWALATCMWANNETGAIQPVEELAAALAAVEVPLHVDAVQVVGKLPINFHQLGATTLAASGHKFGGPRGGGFLLAKRTPAPLPIAFGGGQERGIRPGTVDVASACALAAALAESCNEMEAENSRLRALRDRFQAAVLRDIPDVRVNTVEPALPGFLHLSFAGTDSDSLIMLLDAAGIAASAGSACAAGVNRPSYVLAAMGCADGAGNLRFTLGRNTTAAEVDAVSAALPALIQRARSV